MPKGIKTEDLGLDLFAANPGARAVYARLVRSYGQEVGQRYLKVMERQLSPQAEKKLEASIGKEKRAREDRPNG